MRSIPTPRERVSRGSCRAEGREEDEVYPKPKTTPQTSLFRSCCPGPRALLEGAGAT